LAGAEALPFRCGIASCHWQVGRIGLTPQACLCVWIAFCGAFAAGAQCDQSFAIGRIAQGDAQFSVNEIIPNAPGLAVKAPCHRRELRRFERDFGRRFQTAKTCRKLDDVLGRRRFVVSHVIDASGPRSSQRRFDHGCNIGDVNPIEDLPWLDDAPRRSQGQLHELVSSRA
jgi:hypothetical protein